MSIAAILLAAGQSRRFGATSKLLADLDGQPVLARTAACLMGEPFAQRIAVTGPADVDAVAALARQLGLTVVASPVKADGIGLSIATAVGALDGSITGALILPGDMPLMTRAVICTLLSAFAAHGGQRIVFAARPDGTQANPVVWPQATFAALRGLDGTAGGKSLLQNASPPAIGVTMDDDNAFADIDTPDDLERVRGILRRANSSATRPI